MEECNICLTRIKRRNRKKHEQSKKHKYYFSNLIINKYIVNNDEFDNFKGIFKSHYVNQKKKFNSFDVLNDSKLNGEFIDKIRLSSRIVKKKTYRLFKKNIDGEIGIRPCFEYINECFFLSTVFAMK